MAPIICALYEHGIIEATALTQTQVFNAAVSFARAEGFVVAPETAHAVKAVMDEALSCRESGEAKVIAFNSSGHGHFDLAAYQSFLSNELEDYEYSDEQIRASLQELPKIAG
jgi:tryptophan synthase beta chain